jgi:intracellular sulfur oxidation DsrE/DsrF family protein
MKVVEETIRLIEKQGETARFAITLHGGCVPMVAGRMDDIVSDKELVFAKKAQETLRRLHEDNGVEIVACAMSLEANGIDEVDVVPFVQISPDSFIDTIGYQNDGYALMTFP